MFAGSGGATITGTTQVDDDLPHFLVARRAGGVLTTYVDMIQDGTAASVANANGAGAPLFILGGYESPLANAANYRNVNAVQYMGWWVGASTPTVAQFTSLFKAGIRSGVSY